MITRDAHTIDLDCGIAYARIEGWLQLELGLDRENGAWLYRACGCTCRIELHKLASRSIGLLDLERTRLTAFGDAEALEAFQKLFTLRFMSAGG